MRVIHVLDRCGLNSIEVVCNVTKDYLMRCRNFDVTTIDLIMRIAEALRRET